MKAEAFNHVFVKWMLQNPDVPLIRFLSFGNSEWLLVNSEQASRDIFQNSCYACENPAFVRRFVEEVAGTSIITMEGGVHKEQRRLLSGMGY